jgi:response regulator NasT
LEQQEEQLTPINVALAEDNSDLRNMMAQLLRYLGYRVVSAVSNGAELLDSCLDDVDVVLVDLDMPVVDGLEAAEVIAERGIPVVLISGLPDLEHMVVEKEPIAVRLKKPATAEALNDAIQLALASRSQKRPN